MRSEQQQRDWDLCQATWKRIVDHYGENPGATDFTPKELVVVAVWTVSGIVGNGGFEYLFEGDLPGDPGYQLALESFRVIGSSQAVAAFDGALHLFPGGVVPEDCAERERVFTANPEDARTALASQFWAADDEIVSKLAAYIEREFSCGPTMR